MNRIAAILGVALIAGPAPAVRRLGRVMAAGLATAMARGEFLDVPRMIVPTRNRHADDFFDLAQILELLAAPTKDERIATFQAHDWRRLAEPRETLAIYMGVGTLADVTRELLRYGRAASTPVAFVENGCRPEQRVVIATLATAVEVAATESIRSPSLLIVGGVAALGATLQWYGAAPVDHRPSARTSRAGVQAAVA